MRSKSNAAGAVSGLLQVLWCLALHSMQHVAQLVLAGRSVALCWCFCEAGTAGWIGCNSSNKTPFFSAMILRSLRCYCNKIALCFTRKFCTFLIFPLVQAMKKEIKVALIGGGVVIIVALITIFGSLKTANKPFKIISPAIRNSQNVIGNDNNFAGRDMKIYEAPTSVLFG
ncbi:MAG: hypothetical protein HKK67_09065 [Chlorobiaceae bacterium]|nr:hypothetical protein [Chlorobiaceae bacterium]